MFSNIAMKPVRLCLAIWFIFSVLFVSNVFAASTMNVQGKLTDKQGNPITGLKDLYFRLYNVSIAATPLWTEQHRINLGNDGLFNVRLGESASLDTLAFDKQLYLGISVNGENEMLPRQVLTSSPYALGSIGDFSVGKKLIVNGNVGIGTAGPGAKLDVMAVARTGIYHPTGKVLYVTGDFGTGQTGDGGIEFRHSNATQGIGFGYNTIYQTGINANQDLNIRAIGTGPITLNAVGGATGNVGIGTASPQGKLDVVGGYTFLGGLRINGLDASTNEIWNANESLGITVNKTGGGQTGIYLEAGTGNVGIGTASPGATLTVDAPGGDTAWNTVAFRKASLGPNWSHVHWGATGDWYIRSAASNGRVIIQDSGGNVGIGTAGPGQKLQVEGNIQGHRIKFPGVGGDSGVGADYYAIYQELGPWVFPYPDLRIQYHTGIKYDAYQGYGGHQFFTGHDGTGNPTGLQMQITDKVYIAGNVGIGTDNPGAKLDVAGDVTIRGNRINLGTDGAQTAWIKVEGTHALGFRFSDKRMVVADGWSKNFMISHPLDPQHKYLLHSTLEGPENGVYYRGEAQLINGKTVVQLPSYFEALTRKEGRTVLLTSKFESDEHISMLAASEIKDGRFGVRMIDEKNTSQKFYWEVKAIRADLTPLEVEVAKDE